MTTLTLLVKASNARHLKQIEDSLNAEFGELSLDVKILGTPVNKWVQVSLSGEDEAIATSYIDQKIGTCPIGIKKVQKFSVLNGYISRIDDVKQELRVDVGVFEPKIIQAVIPLNYLQAQLADGRKIGLKKISEIYGFRENLPLSIKVVEVDDEVLQAELSLAQLERIQVWQNSLLDRLIILGASLSEVELVLERTRLIRDVIATESLGMFEYALTCKLGTDAAGLVSIIGRYMRNAVFIVYNPKKIAELIGEPALNL